MTPGGLDTIALSWPAQGGAEVMSAAIRSESVPYARGLLCLDRHPTGARVMAWPEYGIVKCEGRLAAIIDGTADSHRLARRAEMCDAEEACAEVVRDVLGHPPDPRTFLEVSRYDLAVDLPFDDSAEGLAFLRAMRALAPPGYKLNVHQADDGRIETVAVVTKKRGARVFRAYDKSAESGDPRGAGFLARLEAQRRPSKRARHEPRTFARMDLRADYGRTIEPFLRGEPITVTNSAMTVEKLAQQVAQDRLSIARAERLAGSVEFLRRYGRGIYGSNDQSSRRLRALRDQGIAVDDELPDGRALPVSALLRAAVEEFAADG